MPLAARLAALIPTMNRPPIEATRLRQVCPPMVMTTFGRRPDPRASTTSAGTSTPVALPTGSTMAENLMSATQRRSHLSRARPCRPGLPSFARTSGLLRLRFPGPGGLPRPLLRRESSYHLLDGLSQQQVPGRRGVDVAGPVGKLDKQSGRTCRAPGGQRRPFEGGEAVGDRPAELLGDCRDHRVERLQSDLLSRGRVAVVERVVGQRDQGTLVVGVT